MEEMQNQARTRGIYLVANRHSGAECNNLIASIRRCGCNLPIRVIPYGGSLMVPDLRWDGVKLLSLSDFPAEGRAFLAELEGRIRQCGRGHLRRFLCWFGEFDEFLYSDNDIVALMNWEELFPYLENYDVVHADTEFTTGGKFNMVRPDRFEEVMGAGTLQAAMTAGHFLCRTSPRHLADLLAGIAWMEANPEIPIWHDQTLLHVTLVLGQWRVLNLCKQPHGWASSWAGDYKNVLDLIRTIQVERRPISHLHYSGGIASGTQPIDELLLSSLPVKERNRKLLRALLWQASGLREIKHQFGRVKHKIKRLRDGSK
jgi:hypothetical protein